jgi:hypothetical protein
MDRCASTPMLQTYILQGYGAIQPDWVQQCLHLFKRQQINLRKVVLLKNGHPDYFSMVEIHFLLAQADNNTAQPPHPFLAQLEQTLARQSWLEQSVRPSPR